MQTHLLRYLFNRMCIQHLFARIIRMLSTKACCSNLVKVWRRFFASSTDENLSYWHETSPIPLIYETTGISFRQAAEKFPDKEFFSFPHQNIRKTYAQTYQEAKNLAKGFITLGLKRQDRIGIWAPNCYEWVLTQLATAMAGMILVCINPANQAHELEYCLNKVQCVALVAARKYKRQDYYEILTHLCPELSSSKPGDLKSPKVFHLKHVILLEEKTEHGTWNFNQISNASGSESAQILSEIERKIDPDDPVNIQFTSGTTGTPKGATLTHHGTINNALLCGQRLGFHQFPCRLLCAPPLHHAFANVMGVLAPMQYGGMACIASPVFQAQPNLEALQKEKCTVVYGTPTMFIDMINHPDFKKYHFSNLRTGIMSGAPCPAELRKKVIDQMHVQKLTIGYGCTEVSPVIALTFPTDPDSVRLTKVGYPLDHNEVKIVDDKGLTVPCGQPGELWTRGYHVMQGYWGDEEKTREPIGMDRWYRTGDTAVMSTDGYINIVGRKKEMIIRGGENIFPTEIEHFLHEHPKIADVHVFGVPDERLGEEICCWIRLKIEETATVDEIKEFCKGDLAHFKIPKYVAFKNLEDFPMTSTGKVQKFKLKELAKIELGLDKIKTHMDVRIN